MADVRARMADDVMNLSHESPAVQRASVKRILLTCWDMLPAPERKKFLGQVDYGYPFDFIRPERRFPDGEEDTVLEAAARHWGYILPTLDGDERKFAQSFEKLIRFRRTPSEKQATWAKRIYRDWKRWHDTDGDVTE